MNNSNYQKTNTKTMKKRKLLGILGLIVVAAMTIAAYFTPAANAENGQTTITVTVSNPKQPDVEINNPANNSELAFKDGITVDLGFKETEEIEVTVTYGSNTETDTFTPSEETGNTTRTLNFAGLANYYGPVTITAKAKAEGAEDAVKTVTIELVTVTVEIKDPADNNDPKLKITPSRNVARVKIKVVDPANPDGDPLIELEKPAEELEEDVTLPFEANNIPDGDYRFIVESFDTSDEPFENPKGVNYSYEKSPAVPDTGRFAEKLNVSRTDYVIAIAATAAVTVILLIAFIFKRSRKNTK